MKNLLLFFILSLVSSICSGQQLPEDFVVETLPNATMNEYRLDVDNNKYISKSGIGKAIILKKSKKLPVQYISILDGDIYYDSYIVWYRNMPYCIKDEYVKENSFIQKVNEDVAHNYNSLVLKQANSLLKYKSLKKNAIDSLNNRISKLEQRISSHSEDRAQRKIDSVIQSDNTREKRLKAVNDSLFQVYLASQSYPNQLALKNLIINYSFLGGPNTADGCDYHLSFTNKSSKRIKYLHWAGVAYNAVDDPVECEIRFRTKLTGVFTGPVEKDETVDAFWDCIIYNSTAKRIELYNIKIEYMDGSVLNLNKAQIQALDQLPDQYKKTLLDRAFSDLPVYQSHPENYISEEFKTIREEARQEISNIQYEIRRLKTFEANFNENRLIMRTESKMFQHIANAYMEYLDIEESLKEFKRQ